MKLLEPLDGWLIPLQPVLAGLTAADWTRLERFDTDLVGLMDDALLRPGQDSAARAARLLAIRKQLAGLGHSDVAGEVGKSDQGRGALLQGLRQFVSGFYDLDLRDATGAGHGLMILRHAPPQARRSWAARLGRGDLVGIAATERHGGSRLQEITTSARPRPAGGWWISGEKCWVSRLEEAAAFVVFFVNPRRAITAALVPADAPGLRRRLVAPAGLGGWTWGALELADVAVGPDDLVGGDGGGLDVFREHFAHYRPLVTITALGASASVHASVTAILKARIATGILPRLRDTTMVALGRCHAELNAALLAAFAAVQLGRLDSSTAELWARSMKAYGVDAAYRASCELPLLVGALGFQADSQLVKARNDLTGLLYADGIHDSLYRATGSTLTAALPDAGSAWVRPVHRSRGTRTDRRPGRQRTGRHDGQGGATATPAP
jgi:alkylation response protein AidB-like acyl-CoA dehydrogenase